MSHWVFLADPESYGWDELVGEGRAVWDGIKNRIAQNRLKEAAVGDRVVIYHTSPDKALIGIARVSAAAYPDPADDARVVVDVEPVTALQRRIPLAEVKEDDVLSGMGFVRMPRVAVHEVSEEQLERVLELSGTDPSTVAGDDPTGAGGP